MLRYFLDWKIAILLITKVAIFLFLLYYEAKSRFFGLIFDLGKSFKSQVFMLKNLFITTIFPPSTGGIELCLHNIIKRLPKEKAVVLAQENDASQDFDKAQNYRILRKSLESKYLRPKWLLSPLSVLKIVRKEKPELIQAAHGFASYFSAWILKKFLGTPYFVWAYGLDILSMRKSRMMRFFVKIIYKDAAGGVANSNFTKEEMIRAGIDREKVFVIYPGVDSEKFQRQQAPESIYQKYHLPHNKKILLSVSRLVARKGFDLAIKAMPRILKKFPDAIYILGGKGPDEARLKLLVSRASPQVQDAVRFIGFADEQDLPYLYSCADIFLMPSRQINEDVEGFGMVFLEANSCACPVIGGNSGGIPEAIYDGQTGFLVDPKDPQDLAEKVNSILGDKELAKKMGEQGKRRAAEEFSWEKIATTFKKLEI